MNTRDLMRKVGRRLDWQAPIKDGMIDLHKIVKVVVAVLVEEGLIAYDQEDESP